MKDALRFKSSDEAGTVFFAFGNSLERLALHSWERDEVWVEQFGPDEIRHIKKFLNDNFPD